jgi:hypothetical protein
MNFAIQSMMTAGIHPAQLFQHRFARAFQHRGAPSRCRRMKDVSDNVWALVSVVGDRSESGYCKRPRAPYPRADRMVPRCSESASPPGACVLKTGSTRSTMGVVLHQRLHRSSLHQLHYFMAVVASVVASSPLCVTFVVFIDVWCFDKHTRKKGRQTQSRRERKGHTKNIRTTTNKHTHTHTTPKNTRKTFHWSTMSRQ